MKLDRFRREEPGPGLPLAALVDVLFLMIIFLVLGANFDRVDTVRLPEAGGRPPAAAEREPLRLELRADGRLWLDGTPLADAAVLDAIAARKPPAVLLLPDRAAAVGPLFRWYDRIRRTLGLPVQVGVQPPEDAP